MRLPSRLLLAAVLLVPAGSVPAQAEATEAAPAIPARVRVTTSTGEATPGGTARTVTPGAVAPRSVVAQRRSPDEPARTGTETSTATVVSTAAPEPEAGVEVRRLPGGYMSFVRDEPPGGPGPAPDETRRGGVILVPANEAPGLSLRGSESPRDGTDRERPRRRMRRDSHGAEAAAAVGIPELPRERCARERGLLAQRLLELRGIQLGPSEALLVLEESEQPLSGHMRRSLFGLSSVGVGGTLLESSVSHDSETRDRLSALVRCIER